MSLSEYHARQRANALENELRAIRARECKAHEWTTSRTSNGRVTVCKRCGTIRKER